MSVLTEAEEKLVAALAEVAALPDKTQTNAVLALVRKLAARVETLEEALRKVADGVCMDDVAEYARAALSAPPSKEAPTRETLTSEQIAAMRKEGDELRREIERRVAPMKRGPFGPGTDATPAPTDSTGRCERCGQFFVNAPHACRVRRTTGEGGTTDE